jgi:hypothetical protein
MRRKGKPGSEVGAPPRPEESKHGHYNRNGNQRQLAVGKPTALDIWRFKRPYGVWTCADGREVMFNREYAPILERRPGQPVRAANPNEWIWWIDQTWLFNDGTPLSVAVMAMNVALADWGLPQMPKMPSGRVSPGSRSVRRKWPNPYEGVLISKHSANGKDK